MNSQPSLPVVREVLARVTAFLALKNVDSPRLSAEILLAHALGCERQDLFIAMQRPVSPAEQARARALAERRGRGEPVAYILGRKEFFGLDFAVTPGTLIPRPETEHLVEEALARFPPDAPCRFADLGTGCGALAAALASKRPLAWGLALDLSAAALAVAWDNFKQHGVLGRVQPLRGDFGRLPCGDGGLDLVLANPPYVSAGEYQGLSREILDFEPAMAFMPQSGAAAGDGLGAAATLLPEAARVLAPGGWLLMEIGATQGAGALALASGRDWAEARLVRDLAGLDRVLAAQRA